MSLVLTAVMLYSLRVVLTPFFVAFPCLYV
jgi:hypothetical protein